MLYLYSVSVNQLRLLTTVVNIGRLIMQLAVHFSVASCSIIIECTHCIFLTVLHCWPSVFTCQEDGACTHSNILSFCLYTSYGHTTIVAYVCVWFVVTLHVREMLTFSTHCWRRKQKPVLLLKSSTSCRQPLFVTPSFPLFAVQISFPIYIWSAIKSLIWLRFYIDVCPLESNCHACILCVLYGVFEIFINKKNHILSERYVCMRYKREL